MSESARIADQLRRAFHGEAWHGPAVMELLDGVSAERAAAKPIPTAHSIWELAVHIGAWEGFALDLLSGKTPVFAESTPETNWPTLRDFSPSAWKQALARLKQNHDALCTYIAALDDARLAAIVPGRDYSFYYLFHGLAQHALYHAGQIALLKKY